MSYRLLSWLGDEQSSGLGVAAPACRTSNGLCEQCFGTRQQGDALRSRVQRERKPFDGEFPDVVYMTTTRRRVDPVRMGYRIDPRRAPSSSIKRIFAIE
jgi:hypothetical protein